jgi:hypothetical protein
MKNMTIENIALEDLAVIVGGLVQQGLTFKSFPSSDGLWVIELTGGF